jgi:hypothetical protein
MASLAQCKHGRDILQILKLYSIKNAFCNKTNLDSIQSQRVTSVIEAEDKALITLVNGKGSLSTLAIDMSNKTVTFYTLESP